MDAFLWLMILMMVGSGLVLWFGFQGIQKREEEEHGQYYGPNGHNKH